MKKIIIVLCMAISVPAFGYPQADTNTTVDPIIPLMNPDVTTTKKSIWVPPGKVVLVPNGSEVTGTDELLCVMGSQTCVDLAKIVEDDQNQNKSLRETMKWGGIVGVVLFILAGFVGFGIGRTTK